MTDAGAILLRPGKEGRRVEPDAVASRPRGRRRRRSPGGWRLPRPRRAETCSGWIVRRSWRAAATARTTTGIAQLRALLGGAVDVVAFDLPHFHGPDECLHLMSFISPLDADLAVAYLPMMPVRLLQILHERDIRLVEVPDDEFDSMGPNVLALGPRIALALDGEPGDAAAHGGGGRRRPDVRRQRDLPERGGRPHLPDPAARARLESRRRPVSFHAMAWQWWLFLHLAGVLAFVGAHGVSMFVLTGSAGSATANGSPS